MRRLAEGGRIDRSQVLNFYFDQRRLQGFAGDTLASALLANGVSVVGRSFKYHRPRGIMAAGPEEPNALVTLGDGALAEPNLRATDIPLQDGLYATSQNRWPSLGFDVGATADMLSRFLPAGFYYKTFMWPGWRYFEPHIRRAAGLGPAPTTVDPDPERYLRRYHHCDVLVIGAGPAGLAAARAAALAGLDVTLVERDVEPGGSLLWRGGTVDGMDADGFIAGLPPLRLLTRATAIGYYDHNAVTVLEHLPPGGPARQRLWQIRARQVVLATGAIERHLVFPNNDRPGVMLADATLHYLRRQAVACGQRAIFVTNNDSAYDAALALAEAGVEIAAVADVRRGADGDAPRRARERGLKVLDGVTALATTGRGRVSAVRIGDIGGGGGRWMEADLVALSGGWTPTVHLHRQAGGTVRWDETALAFLPDQARQAHRSAGAAAGAVTLAQALRGGHEAGAAAAAALGAEPSVAAPEAEGCHVAAPRALWQVALPPSAGKQFVDFQNDVTAGDVALAARENFVSVEHLKRYTTLGMATDQGKTSNLPGLAILAETTARPIPEIGTTTFRPPYVAVTMGAVAADAVGEDYQPRRRLPAHDEHVAAGALFEDFGPWPRPAAYLRPGEDLDAAARREARAARAAAVLFDATPLGKIEVFGRDAETFLERIYCTPVAGLKAGRIRYGAMLTEHGVVLDDGVLARLGPDRFLLSPSSGAALRVYRWLEEWRQGEWLDLDVRIANLTHAFACVAVAGPQARAVVARIAPALDLSPAALPHMAFVDGLVAGVAARIARVSFTGELQYEITVPASHGAALWRLLQGFDEITPIGIEAWLRLRLDKGYIHVGSDSDGTSLPGDVGFGPLVARKTGDFVGKRSLLRPDAVRPDREQLVGLVASDPGFVLPVGAQILPGQGVALPVPAIGRVTSACFSEALGHGIALGRLRGGRGRIGDTVEIYHLGRRLTAQVTALPFFDPKGERLHG